MKPFPSEEALKRLYTAHAKESNKLIQYMSSIPGDINDHLVITCMAFGATLAAATKRLRDGDPEDLDSLIKLAQIGLEKFAWQFHELLEAGEADVVTKPTDKDTRH